MKKLAPYREKDHKVSKTAQRKKVEQLLKEVGRGKRRKESRAAPPAPAGADSAEPSPVAASVAKAATPSAPAAAVDGDAGGKKKKTRRSKKKHVKGEE